VVKIHLSRLLDKRDLKPADLVRMTGIRSSTISAYCKNKCKRINIADLDSICISLNCRLDELITYVPPKKRKGAPGN
jgi:putative transcriptional regulator